jgi:hypothetical protein
MNDEVKLTRQCRACREVLPVSSFHRHRTRAMGYTCKECARKASDRLLAPRREVIRQIKMESGCTRCGYREHWAALDFDHGPGFKPQGTAISNLVTKTTSVSLEELTALARSCTVLCSNCHRILTWERRQHGRFGQSSITDEELYERFLASCPVDRGEN